MQGIWDLGGRTVLLIIASSGLFGATAAFAIASYARMSRLVAITVGIVFGPLGAAILGLVALVRRGSRSRRRSSVAGATAAAPVDTISLSQEYAGFDSWDVSPMRVADGGSSDGFGFDDFDSFEPRYTQSLSENGPIARRSFSERISHTWLRSKTGKFTAAFGGLALASLIVSIFAGWLDIDAAIVPRFWFYPIGTGLDVALAVTVLIAGVAILSLATRPFRSVAVLLAWVADTWLVFLLLMISSRYAVAGFLEQLGTLSLSAGDLLKTMGVTARGGVVELPAGVDLSSIGMSGSTIDLSKVDLSQVIPNVSIDIGPGVYLVLVFAVMANVASFAVLVAADRGGTFQD